MWLLFMTVTKSRRFHSMKLLTLYLFILASFYQVFGQNLVISASTFECGKNVQIVCTRTVETFEKIAWRRNAQLLCICTLNQCLPTQNPDYTFTADNGTWTLTFTPVQMKDDGVSFLCYESSGLPEDGISFTPSVTVPIDSSAEVSLQQFFNNAVLTARSSCTKPVDIVQIDWKCINKNDSSIEENCPLSVLDESTSACSGNINAFDGPKTSRKQSVAQLTTYNGNYFELVKVKATFTDGTNSIEKLSGDLKVEAPPRIQQPQNCSVVENTNKTFSCNLSSGDPSTVRCTWTKPDRTTQAGCNLDLKPVTRNDAGVYSCLVQNNAGNDTKSFYLDILYPPSKPSLKLFQTEVTGSISNVLKDTDVTVTCSSFAKPNQLEYTWSPSGRSSDAQLVINSVSPDDSKLYSCQVTNRMNPTCGTEITGSSSSNFTLRVVYPPENHVVTFNSSHLIDTSLPIQVVEGSSFTLKCSAVAEPASRYKWDKQSDEGDVITIQGLSSNQNNSCTASNDFQLFNGSMISRPSALTVQILMLYAPKVVGLQNKQIIEGRHLSQKCEVIHGSPSTTFYLWTSASGQTVQQEQTLTISNVKPNDAGNYMCEAWNILQPTFGSMRNQTSSGTFTLEVLYAPVLKQISNQSVVEGSTFVQQCEVGRHGNPPETISWSFREQNFSSSTISLTNVTRHQTGFYEYKAINIMEPTDSQAENGVDMKRFYLNVFYKTELVSFTFDGNHTTSVKEENSENVQAKCTFDSNPASDIQLISNTYGGYRRLSNTLTSNTLEYTLETTTCNDTGVYTCIGRNNYTTDNVSMNFQLNIRCPPKPQFEVSTNITEYKKLNETAIFSLTLVAYPIPPMENISWYKDTIKIINDSNHLVGGSNLNPQLQLKRLNDVDFGQYKLKVEYTANSTNNIYEHLFFLAPKDRPQMPTNFSHIERYLSDTTALFTWKPGFDGGLRQHFIILYRSQESEWKHINISSPATNATLRGLQPGVIYQLKIFASNEIGNSSEAETIVIATKLIDGPHTSNTLTIAAGVGGGVVVILIAVAVVLVYVRRRKHSDQNGGYSRKTSENTYYNTVQLESRNESHTDTDRTVYEGLGPVTENEHIYGKLGENGTAETSVGATVYENVPKALQK